MKQVIFRGRRWKIASSFCVICLIALSGNLIAKERRGAELVVQRQYGSQVKGELIAVKRDSILLLESASGTDVSIDVSDISNIVLKKSKTFESAGLGVLIGCGLGALAGVAWGSDFFGFHNVSTGPRVLGLGLGGGVIGGIGGLIYGASKGAGEKYQIEGKSDSEVQAILKQLALKARVRDFR